MRIPNSGLMLLVALATASTGPASGQGDGSGGASTGGGAATGPGTNAAGTAQAGGGAGPRGSTTVGRPGNPAGGANIGRIDGTVTAGPSLQGDDEIRSESSRDSDVGRKIKSICKGC
ncbi:hypothetical protein ACVIIV_006205 [Bradyrhizobium sp. USDA 4354]